MTEFSIRFTHYRLIKISDNDNDAQPCWNIWWRGSMGSCDLIQIKNSNNSAGCQSTKDSVIWSWVYCRCTCCGCERVERCFPTDASSDGPKVTSIYRLTWLCCTQVSLTHSLAGNYSYLSVDWSTLVYSHMPSWCSVTSILIVSCTTSKNITR